MPDRIPSELGRAAFPKMRGILIIVGLLTVLISAFIENAEFGAIPGFIYLAGILALIAGFLGRRFALKRLVIAVAVLALALRLSYSGLTSFRHRVSSVRPGISVEELRLHMAGFREGAGLIDPNTGEELPPDGQLIFRDPGASPSHHAEWIFAIRNGRVTSVHFSPD